MSFSFFIASPAQAGAQVRTADYVGVAQSNLNLRDGAPAFAGEAPFVDRDA